MPYTPIDPLPDAPNRTQSPAVFSANTDAFLTALPPNVAQINAAGAYFDTVAAAADASAAESAASAVESGASAVASAASAIDAEAFATNSASSANFKGEWSTLTGAAAKPFSVSYGGVIWVLLNDLADITASEPSVSADWLVSGGGQWQATQTASFNAFAGPSYLVEAIGTAVDVSLPITLTDGSAFTVHNSSASTDLVRVLNSLYTIRGSSGSLTLGNNLILEAGDTVKLVAKGTLILEVV